MAELIRPPSLRAFLDAGCDITTLPGWECLSEGVLLLSSSLTPAQRAEDASSLRNFAETWLRGERTWLDVATRRPVDQDVLTRFLWEAECLEDPELAERLEAALPAEKRADLLLISVEMLWPEQQQ